MGCPPPRTVEPVLRDLIIGLGGTGESILAASEYKYSRMRPWTPSQHHCFLQQFRVAVEELLLIHARLRRETNSGDNEREKDKEEKEKEKEKEKDEEGTGRQRGGGTSFGSLPVMVLHMIFGYLARGYAEKPMPEFLMEEVGVTSLKAVDTLLQLFMAQKPMEIRPVIAYHSGWNASFRKILRGEPAEKEEEDEEENDVVDPASMTMVELRKQLKARGLDTKGNKAVLIDRLIEALEEDHMEDETKEKEEKIDLSSMTVVKLREQLKKRGLDTKGNKAVLLRRLTTALGRDGEDEEENEEEAEEKKEKAGEA